MPQPTIGNKGIVCLGCPAVWPSVVCPAVNTYYAWCSIFLRSGVISVRLATNIHCMNWHCWKVFQGQRLKVKVVTGPVAL